MSTALPRPQQIIKQYFSLMPRNEKDAESAKEEQKEQQLKAEEYKDHEALVQSGIAFNEGQVRLLQEIHTAHQSSEDKLEEKKQAELNSRIRNAGNYVVIEGNVATAEVTGGRYDDCTYDVQEDTFCSAQLPPEFMAFSPETQNLVIQRTFQRVSQAAQEHKAEGGLTANISWAQSNASGMQVTTGVTGDTRLYAVVYRPATGKIVPQMQQEAKMNRNGTIDFVDSKLQGAVWVGPIEHRPGPQALHPAYQPQNNAALVKSRHGGEYKLRTAAGLLASTYRAINERGVDPTPDIARQQFNMKEGDRLVLIPTCDGLDKLTQDQIAAVVQQQMQQQAGDVETSARIATALVQKAYEDKDSRDNMTCSVQISPPFSRERQNMVPPTYICIADGHGGVSLAQTFSEVNAANSGSVFFGQNIDRVLRAEVSNYLKHDASLKSEVDERLLEAEAYLQDLWNNKILPEFGQVTLAGYYRSASAQTDFADDLTKYLFGQLPVDDASTRFYGKDESMRGSPAAMVQLILQSDETLRLEIMKYRAVAEICSILMNTKTYPENSVRLAQARQRMQNAKYRDAFTEQQYTFKELADKTKDYSAARIFIVICKVIASIVVLPLTWSKGYDWLWGNTAEEKFHKTMREQPQPVPVPPVEVMTADNKVDHRFR